MDTAGEFERAVEKEKRTALFCFPCPGLTTAAWDGLFICVWFAPLDLSVTLFANLPQGVGTRGGERRRGGGGLAGSRPTVCTQ